MDDLKQRILAAALPLVVFDGWTLGTLEAAAKSLGLTMADVTHAFPAGVVDAVTYHSTQADEAMVATLRRDYHLPSMKVRERIATAVMVRLRQQAPHREAVRRATAFLKMPWNMPAATKALYATVDAMWREAGDTSTDYNFYTKRLLLSKVYLATLPVWLDDNSPDLAATEAFLRRRIENVMQIEKFKTFLRSTLKSAPKRAS